MLKGTLASNSATSIFKYFSCGTVVLVVHMCVVSAFHYDHNLFLVNQMSLLSADMNDNSTIEGLRWTPVVFDCLSI